MSDLRGFTLWARGKLVQETQDLLLQLYGLQDSGRFLPSSQLPVLGRSLGAQETRKRLEKLFLDEQDAEIAPNDAYKKLVKEVAFTHLNRLVAFKLMEGRKLVRGVIDRLHDSNGFKMYVADPQHDADLKLYDHGSMPQDDFEEGPRDRAYRHFLLWQCQELAKEIRVLFDPDNLPSRLFPRPRILRELIERLNVDQMKHLWASGSEETIGWVYQFFNAEEKSAAFERVFKRKKKFEKSDIPAATQVFTPRWIVRFLVENSLGRLWLSMHPDSRIEIHLSYLTPLPADPPSRAMKPVREIRVLDPATGTMHFGLVAFDLLAEMYREEIIHAGHSGWPAIPSVEREQDIPAAILANNLFGIDIDLRAVQLAALALFLRAKAFNKNSVLLESNLACADVAIFRGQHLAKITTEMVLPAGITRDLFEKFRDSLEESTMMGSLVRLDQHFQNLEGGRLLSVINAYVESKRSEGIDETYFANESSKGLGLLKILGQKYDVVCTNPPYMSNRNMTPKMGEFLKVHYKKSKGDLYSAFVERCTELLQPNGRVAMLTQQSFMFISSFDDLRDRLLGAAAIEIMAHVGARAFVEVTGEKVNTTAFVLRREEFEQARRGERGVYIRLVKEPDAESKRLAFEQALARRKSGEADFRVYEYCQGDFAAIPGSPWVYWITPALRSLFVNLRKLGELAQPKHGMSTGKNERFLRFWWEVGRERIGFCSDRKAAASSHQNWFPYMKGGTFRRWFGNQSQVLKYGRLGAELAAAKDDGSAPGHRHDNPEYYFRRGVTYSYLTAGAFSARLSPGGFIFDVAGSSLFPDDVELVLALLNSQFVHFALKLINPTVNFQVGDLARLPVPRHSSGTLREMVDRAVELARADSGEDETTYDFVAPPEWPNGASSITKRRDQLSKIEQQIDEEVYRLYEISSEDRKAIEDELAAPVDSSDEAAESATQAEQEVESEHESPDCEEVPSVNKEILAYSWISYAVGLAVGHFQAGVGDALGFGRFAAQISAQLRTMEATNGMMVLEEGHPDDLPQQVLNILYVVFDETETENIVRCATGKSGALRQTVEDFLMGPFFKSHVKRYRKRPVYWLLQSPDRNYSVYLFHERATESTLPLLQGTRYLGGRMYRVESDLQQAKQKEATTAGAEKLVWAKKAREIAEVLEDLRAFDRHIAAVSNVPIIDHLGNQTNSRWQPELDDGVILNAAPLRELAPAWKRVDAKLDLKKTWRELEEGKYDWSKTAMRYWPQRVLKACKENKSFAIAQGLV